MTSQPAQSDASAPHSDTSNTDMTQASDTLEGDLQSETRSARTDAERRTLQDQTTVEERPSTPVQTRTLGTPERTPTTAAWNKRLDRIKAEMNHIFAKLKQEVEERCEIVTTIRGVQIAQLKESNAELQRQLEASRAFAKELKRERDDLLNENVVAKNGKISYPNKRIRTPYPGRPIIRKERRI